MKKRLFGIAIFLAFAAIFYFNQSADQVATLQTNPISIPATKAAEKNPRNPASVPVVSKVVEIKIDSSAAKSKSTLKEILKNKDYCALVELEKKQHRYTRDEDDMIAEHLFGPKNPDIGDDEKNWTLEDYLTLSHGNISDSLGAQKYEILKFFNALYFSGFLHGMSPEKLDFKKSYEILTELKNMDPRNGAYPFFMAAVKENLNAPQSEINDQLNQALSSPAFSTFDALISQTIYELGLNDLVDSFASGTLISIKPSANLNPPYKLLKNYLAKHPELQDSAIQFGKTLMKDQHDEQTGFVDIYQSINEFSVGQSIYMAAWKSRYPNVKMDPILSTPLRSMNDIIRKKFGKEMQVFEQASKQPGNCPLDLAKNFLQKRQTEFLRYKQNHR